MSNTIRTGAVGFVLAALALLTAGCGKSGDRAAVYPVRGQVSFDGRPAAGAFVVFHPQQRISPAVPAARAQVGKDGSFSLSTYEADDGAPAGQYVVTVLWPQLVRQGDEFVAGPNALPPRYADPRTSDLRVRVAEGKNELPPLSLRR